MLRWQAIALVAGVLLSTVDIPSSGKFRRVTFRSHLGGDVADDPIVRPSESVNVVPAANERTFTRDPVLVVLPHRTPYTADMQVYYLRGYAVGFMYGVNTPPFI